MPLLQYGWSDLRAVRDGRWKYILAPKPELYDLDRDPGELHNLVDAEAGRARALRGSIEARLKLEERSAHTASAAAGIPPEMLERLGALGYIGAGGSPGRKSAGVDPKDKVADYKALRELMQQGLIAIRAGRPSDALAPLQAASRRGVDSYESHYYLARAYTALSRWREASAEVRAGGRQAAGGCRGVARPGRKSCRAARRARRDPRVREAGRARARRRGRQDAAR